MTPRKLPLASSRRRLRARLPFIRQLAFDRADMNQILFAGQGTIETLAIGNIDAADVFSNPVLNEPVAAQHAEVASPSWLWAVPA